VCNWRIVEIKEFKLDDINLECENIKGVKWKKMKNAFYKGHL